MTALIIVYVVGAVVTYAFMVKHLLQEHIDNFDFVIASCLGFLLLPFYPIFVPLWLIGKLSGLE